MYYIVYNLEIYIKIGAGVLCEGGRACEVQVIAGSWSATVIILLSSVPISIRIYKRRRLLPELPPLYTHEWRTYLPILYR